ncbi:uncharacterized protein LOC105213908 [Zeugodacus cucurbitae]|uniref:Serendipity locus protein H-1 n=1 Tax=Zeugodacus cucurbitae TaxID=28588 RepID=A0A0A1WVW9_ZEUCU|nr:uncharacterized protein LOC105213908 [Zeugodacus cucurbitae]
MRILRSQYLKLKAEQSPDNSTTTKTTTLTALHDERQIRQTRMTSKAIRDVNSIQTVTKAAHTTVERDSIITTSNTTSAIYRRNSSLACNDTSKCTAEILQNALYAAKHNLGVNCADNSPGQLTLQKRRQTLACVNDDFLKEQILNALKIKLINTPTDQYTRINVVVRFYEEGTMWYTRFYRSYQDVLWVQIPRVGQTFKTKWHFKCEVCQKKLCSFSTLKSHLNIHMGFFPYRCEYCPKQYPARGSFTRHVKQKH